MRLLGKLAMWLARSENGQVTAWAVGIALLLFAIMALSLDVGFWFVERRSGQNRADASVLAAVQELPAADVTNATNVAQTWLEKNGEDESVCDGDNSPAYSLFDGGFAYADTDDDGLYDKIRACVSKDGLLIFSRILGLTGVDVRAVAAAGVLEEPARYALMAMNPDSCVPGDGDKSLYLHGNPEVILGNEGSTYTASPCLEEGLYLQGNTALLEGGLHDFCGDDYYETSNNLVGTPRPGICNIPDPWGGETQPVPPPCRPNDKYTSPLDPNEGAYCKKINENGPIVLLPGVHVFRDEFKMTGGSLTGEDVLLYFTCSSGTTCCPTPPGNCSNVAAGFRANGATIDISPPDGLPHIVIWVDRTSAQPSNGAASVDINGNAQVIIGGHIYNWNNGVSLGGTQDGQNWTFDGTILGDTIEIYGNATYNINWDEDFAPKIFIPSLIE